MQNPIARTVSRRIKRNDALKPQADAIAAAILRKGTQFDTWDELRAHVDLRTGGDLDCVPLDVLTDMVGRRVFFSPAQ